MAACQSVSGGSVTRPNVPMCQAMLDRVSGLLMALRAMHSQTLPDVLS